jgi:hypothetical protein
MILVTDPIGSPLLLLGSERAKLLYVDLLLLPADKPEWIYFFERLSGMKKAALEKLSQKCEIFFFSLKSIKWAGRWGRLYEDFVEINYAKKTYTTTPKYQKNQKFFCLD